MKSIELHDYEHPNHACQCHITNISVIESTASAVKRWDNAKYDVPLKQEVTVLPQNNFWNCLGGMVRGVVEN